MPEQLPVPLALPRPKHLLSERRNLEDYEQLSNFQNMMISAAGDLWIKGVTSTKASSSLIEIPKLKESLFWRFQKRIIFHITERKFDSNSNKQTVI